MSIFDEIMEEDGISFPEAVKKLAKIKTNAISFVVPGHAVPFARTRINKGGALFTPTKQRSYEGVIKTFALKAMDGQPPMKGPIHLIIRADYLIPGSWSKKKRAGAEWKESKPDADNIAKIFKDAMNKIVFEDDAQVAYLIVQKKYGIFARVTVSVMELQSEPCRT